MLRRDFEIAGRPVGPMHSPYVIGEVGSNFNQSLDLARRLTDSVAQSGADAVKFQLFRAEKLYPDRGKMYEVFKSIELNPDWVPRLAEHARTNGIHFLASAFDEDSVQVLARAGIPAMKVASSETTNLSLLHRLAAIGAPMIVSTGMCDMVDVEEAVAICQAAGNRNVALLQCGTVYPLSPELANLRVMETYRSRFGCPVGFSDHTLGTASAAIAVGAGACVLEKHVTLDRSMSGPDHFYAVEPGELKAYVAAAREAHSMLGDGVKDMLPEERRVGRRDGLHAARNLASGHRLRPEDIEVRRPATGIRGRDLPAVIGARVREAVAEGDPLKWENIVVGGDANGS